MSRLQTMLATLLFAVALAIALQQGIRAVDGVTSPYDIDNFRDVASAQSILDGDFPDDPAYKGEKIWYNPLMPAAVALTSRLTGYNAERSYVQAGPYLNALGLVAFFIMLSCLWNPWVGLIASTSLIFAPPYNEIPWATPTYSPWLFAANFAPLFFYIGLIALAAAARRQTLTMWLLTGISLGIAFMAHTAPALILGTCGLVAVGSMDRLSATSDRPGISKLTAIGLFIVTAFIVSLPMLRSILWHYHLSILHPAPNNWSWEGTALANFRSLLKQSINYKNILAIIGFIFVAYRLKASIGSRLILTWLTMALGLFAYGLLQQWLAFKYLPPLLPNYHAYVYIQSVGHVLVGCGVWGLISVSEKFGHFFAKTPVFSRFVSYIPPVLATVYVVLFIALLLPKYLQRSDSHGVRIQSQAISAQRRASGLTEEIRRLTPKGSVILSAPYDSIFLVVPANRHAIIMPLEFSNPYVEYEPRVIAQREMLSAFLAQDSEKFMQLATRYSVSHILLAPTETAQFDALTSKTIQTQEVLRKDGMLLLGLGSRKTD